MADKKISQLTSASTPLAGSEVLPIVQSGATVKVAVSNLTAGRTVSAAALEIPSSNGSCELGAPGSVNTPFIDFHSAGTSNDYDTRLLAYGGSASAGQGNIKFYGANFVLDTGNIVQGTAAKGVNFTANTPAAGMTSQLLNWYEEGTWTPSDQSGAGLSLTITKAVYQRTGNKVTAFCYITYPSTANTSLTKVGGLPFTVGTNMYMPLSVAGDTGLALYGYTLSATTNFQFVNSSNVGITNDQLSGKFLLLTITYFI